MKIIKDGEKVYVGVEADGTDCTQILIALDETIVALKIRIAHENWVVATSGDDFYYGCYGRIGDVRITPKVRLESLVRTRDCLIQIREKFETVRVAAKAGGEPQP